MSYIVRPEEGLKFTFEGQQYALAVELPGGGEEPAGVKVPSRIGDGDLGMLIERGADVGDVGLRGFPGVGGGRGAIGFQAGLIEEFEGFILGPAEREEVGFHGAPLGALEFADPRDAGDIEDLLAPPVVE